MRRVVCLVLSLIVLAPTLALAQAYRCRFDDVVRKACCCPGEDQREQAERGEGGARHRDHAPAMKATCCCETIAGSVPDTSARATAATGAQVPAAVLVAVAAVAPEPVLALRGVPAARPSARAPPGPLFLRHCALLI